MSKHAILVVVLVAGLLAGCLAPAEAGSQRAGSTEAAPAAAAATTQSPTVSRATPNASLADASDCPLTRPSKPFLAPLPRPEQPPAYYRAVWYGTNALWTMIDPNGEVWSGLPRSAGGLGQKTFWWSADWQAADEPEPAISVTGTRRDGPGFFQVGPPGTNAFADFGSAMLIGVGFPTGGCWELTARYKGAELSYVVWVADD